MLQMGDIEKAVNSSSSRLAGSLALFVSPVLPLPSHFREVWLCRRQSQKTAEPIYSPTGTAVLMRLFLSSHSVQFTKLRENYYLLAHYFSTKTRPHWVSKWQDCRAVSRREGCKDQDLPLPQGWEFKLYLSPLTRPRAGALITRKPSELRGASLAQSKK